MIRLLNMQIPRIPEAFSELTDAEVRIYLERDFTG